MKKKAIFFREIVKPDGLSTRDSGLNREKTKTSPDEGEDR
jgi:hypothetical protein